MAERSYFWDGTTVGDATLAPYDETEFVAAPLYGIGYNLIINDYLNMLEVKSSGAGDASITVGTGAAYVYGWYYENTALLTFALGAQGGGLNRIDLITLQYDAAAQTVRAVVVAGVAAASPAVPATPATAIPLAYVYVSDGFGAASTVSFLDIHDQRLINYPGVVNDRSLEQRNLIPNSEYLAYPVPASVPTAWQLYGGATASYSSTNFSSAPRGNSIDVVIGGANQGILINLTPPEQDQDKGVSTVYTLVGSIKTTAGQSVPQLAVSRVYSTGAADAVVVRNFRRIGTYNFFIRFTVDNSDIAPFSTLWSVDALRISFTGTNGTFAVGQLRLSKGAAYSRRREEHEVIMFETALAEATLTDTLKANATTNIDLTALFGGMIPRSVRGLILRIRARDTGSAAAAVCSLTIRSRNRVVSNSVAGLLDIAGVPNSIPRETLAIVGLVNAAPHGFQYIVNGSASPSMRITIEIVGIIT